MLEPAGLARLLDPAAKVPDGKHAKRAKPSREKSGGGHFDSANHRSPNRDAEIVNIRKYLAARRFQPPVYSPMGDEISMDGAMVCALWLWSEHLESMNETDIDANAAMQSAARKFASGAVSWYRLLINNERMIMISNQLRLATVSLVVCQHWTTKEGSKTGSFTVAALMAIYHKGNRHRLYRIPLIVH